MSKRTENAFKPINERLVGDDLDDSALDDLYNAVILGEDIGGGPGFHGRWWNKPHQILNRLLLRLARAECKDEKRALEQFREHARKDPPSVNLGTCTAILKTQHGHEVLISWDEDGIYMGDVTKLDELEDE